MITRAEIALMYIKLLIERVEQERLGTFADTPTDPTPMNNSELVKMVLGITNSVLGDHLENVVDGGVDGSEAIVALHAYVPH